MAKGEAGERDGYHHRGLRLALINAADAILRERGIEGFTLREAARRAGVSAAAPGHHFGNSAGLLTEVAILGFEELTRFLAAGVDDRAGNGAVAGSGHCLCALCAQASWPFPPDVPSRPAIGGR